MNLPSLPNGPGRPKKPDAPTPDGPALTDAQRARLAQIVHGLNPAQREGVEFPDGPCLIVAGAGSGKTRVLTHRIAYLMARGTEAFQILSLTFTNKAAREMRHRIDTLVGPSARDVWMGTFHSVFARILRIESDRLGYPRNFTIYDTEDSRSALRAVIKELGLDDKVYKPNVVGSRISSAKNRLVSVREYLENPQYREVDQLAMLPEIGRIYARYQDRLFKCGAMDFDDLLFQTNVLFRDHLDVLNKYQQKFHYLLVDEYQDTNLAQYLIIRKLAAVRRNICVVGDDAQSIYAFRGADISNILNFSKDYPDLRLVRLEQNYRSTKHIVGLANSVIRHNRNQIEKNLFTDNESGDQVELVKAQSDQEEARTVATQIFEERSNKGLGLKDFAILYRTNAQSRALEEALRRLNLKYKIYGGLSFYQRKEIRDLIAYLRLTVNENDEEAFKRVINYPRRGIGDTTIARLTTAALEQGEPLGVVMSHARQFLDARSGQAVENFAVLMQSFRQSAMARDAYSVVSQIAKESGLLRDLYEDKTPEGVSRYENVQELMNAVKAYVDDPDVPADERTLEAFLATVSLATDVDEEGKDDQDAITLMTVHSAKGLEFPQVFVVGIEENLFPSQMALQDRDGLEEERRLFYVACTRAQQRLTLSYATSRYRYGQIFAQEPSRFLEEIDGQHLKVTRRYEPTEDHPIRFIDQFRERQGQKATAVGLSATRPVQAKKYVPSPDFRPARPDELSVGQRVEHQKFGFGRITQIDESQANRRAQIAFEEVGDKTLVLSFAKLMIHP